MMRRMYSCKSQACHPDLHIPDEYVHLFAFHLMNACPGPVNALLGPHIIIIFIIMTMIYHYFVRLGAV